MKAIIGGKVYNTETAVKISENGNGLSHNDFNYLSQELYKTKNTGAFFLYSVGGANTIYSTRSGNMSSGSSSIEVLSTDKAYALLEKWNDTVAIEENFSSMIEEA